MKIMSAPGCMSVKGKAGGVLTFTLLWIRPLCGVGPLRLERNHDAMGSTYSLILYGTDLDRMENAATAAFEEVDRIDALLSNYKVTSEWSRINRSASQHPVRATAEMFGLLSSCLEYSRASGGTFDITVGPLMRAWGFHRNTGHIPQDHELRAALKLVGYRHVLLDPSAQTVRFDEAGVELDPGGIGKGYAVDRMVQVLKDNGITTALIAASTSSIYGMGAPPGEPVGWRVEIRDPNHPRHPSAAAFLKDMSLSTSGSYEKFFMAGGRLYSHIMDPRCGRPAQGTISVSVVAPRTLDSEAWTKPYFINGRRWSAAHKPKEFRVFFCEDRPENSCAWIE